MAQLKVVGLRELRRGLAQADAALPKELQRLNKSVVTELVPEAQAAMAAVSPRAGSRAIGTIRALASATRAQLAGGTASVPWYMGKEWGSIRFKQFPGKNPEGYALYPTVTRNMPRIVEKYTKLLEELTREAFPG